MRFEEEARAPRNGVPRAEDSDVPTQVRERVLDGWRALSILLVLAGHLLPLGPSAWKLNEAAAVSGMALFFVLSGYLITSFLLRRPDVKAFLVRRLCRIVPLAWLYVVVVLVAAEAAPTTWFAHLLFYGNLPPFWLLPSTAHLWSLCVEMHFYLGIALAVLLGGRRALLLLPLLCLAATTWRAVQGVEISIVTLYRADEILAGATLALIRHRWPLKKAVPNIAYVVLGGLLLASSHAGWLSYMRPYFAAALVGLSLCDVGSLCTRELQRGWLAYIASVSYALYVFHIGLVHTWFGSGDLVIRYLKRPLLFAVLFTLAHVSTFHFESRWIALGKRLTSERDKRRDGERSGRPRRSVQ